MIDIVLGSLLIFTAVQEQVESVNVYHEGIPDRGNWLGGE